MNTLHNLNTIDLPGLGVSAVTSNVKLPVSRENPSVMLMPAGGLGCQFPERVKQSMGEQTHTYYIATTSKCLAELNGIHT